MRVQVLDHGYVNHVETWGSDVRIVEAARMSTDKGFQGWGPKHSSYCAFETSDVCICENAGGNPGDEKLLRYLWEHKHATPFEMAGMVVEVQAPIFVFREWHRHRTQSYNELSARYTQLPNLNYVPTVERLLMNADGSNKQAGRVKGARALTENDARNFQDALESQYATLQTLYEANLAAGVPKELARLAIPVGRYSRMRASANLRNWLAFLTLRLDPSAQWEIRQYAAEVGNLIQVNFPRTYELFAEGR